MAIQFFPEHCSKLDDVLNDIRDQGLWPHTYLSEPTAGLAEHWHEQDVHVYLIEGSAVFRDVKSGQVYHMQATDKLVIPTRTLHAEGSTSDHCVYIIGTTAPIRVSELLHMRSPAEL